MAAASFTILVLIAGFGDRTGAALPRSGNTAVLIAYSVVELVVVVVAMLIAIAYRPDRPYRTNYLLLACAIVMLAASDRVMAYLRTIGTEHGELWGGLGFILGPLLIAFAVLELPERSVSDLSRRLLDWVQLALPYVGLVGIATIYVFHLLIGRRLTTIQLYAALVMILLITIRQVIAIRSQRLLTGRLMEAQSRLAHVHHDSLTGLPNWLLFAEPRRCRPQGPVRIDLRRPRRFQRGQ